MGALCSIFLEENCIAIWAQIVEKEKLRIQYVYGPSVGKPDGENENFFLSGPVQDCVRGAGIAREGKSSWDSPFLGLCPGLRGC